MVGSEDKSITQSGELVSDGEATTTDSVVTPFAAPQNDLSAPDTDTVVKPETEEQSEKLEKTNKIVKEDNADNGGGSFAVGEFISVGIKAVAVTLSVVFLLLAILTVAMPLSAMRTFNKLGWSERALNSGDRYITRRLEKNGADMPDDIGNYATLSTKSLNDADMREAYDVCIGLSRELMTSSAKKGDSKSAQYFADRLEKYTRQYMSLNGIQESNRQKSEYNVDNIPDIRMRPYVYDYSHTVMLDNFRARTYTGELDKMLYDSGRSGDCVIGIQTLANTYETSSIPSGAQSAVGVIDGFVDYVGQLGEYLSVKLDALGIPARLNESNIGDYRTVLDGTEFELFITPAGGYTEIYNKLKGGFSRYAQAAADFNAVTIDDELHKLYWLQTLGSASTKLWYMSMLLYYDATGSYGMSQNAIIQEYNRHTCELYMFVDFDLNDGFGRKPTEIIDVYNKLMGGYVSHFI